jgi:transcriptional regulator with XRE-family HTH domain
MGGKYMNICEILAINLKYYRKKYNLSQEKFAEILGTTLSYLNQIENGKIDVKSSTIDKFARNINNYDNKVKIKSEDLVRYDKSHITSFNRIDEKK